MDSAEAVSISSCSLFTHLVAHYAKTLTASKPFSEATTADNGLNPGDASPKDFSSPPQYIPKISQGRATYEEYLASGEIFVRAALDQAEVQAVKAYIQGMRQPFRRKPVWEALEAKGWTWENARHELQKIVDEGKRRRRSRRTVQLPPLGKME